MIKSYTDAMRNYATFSGRMSRVAYWQFVLVYIGISIIAIILDSIIGTATDSGGVLVGIVALAHVVPQLAGLARRLHDSDKPAWWLLAMLTGIGGLLMIAFACLSGTPGPNRFGVPHDAHADDVVPDSHRSPSVHSASNQGAGQVDIVAELERLATLRSTGSLSDSEFDVMKSRLLARNT